MKPAQIPLKPLRDIAAKQLEGFIAEYPEQKPLAEQLKKSVAELLAGDSADFETIQELLPKIDEAADKLDDGFVCAAAQDVINEVEKLARKSLSQGVPVFPEVAVSLSLPVSKTDAASVKAGHRTKLGGEPQWVQSDETPLCDSCQKTMTFVAQIDSIAMQDNALGKSLKEKDSFMFADVGMVYVFLCTKCYDTKSVVQSG